MGREEGGRGRKDDSTSLKGCHHGQGRRERKHGHMVNKTEKERVAKEDSTIRLFQLEEETECGRHPPSRLGLSAGTLLLEERCG